MKFRILILGNWWIHFLSLSKFNVSNMKNCSNHPEYCFLLIRLHKGWKLIINIQVKYTQFKFSSFLQKTDLFLFANSNNIHSSPCCKIIMSIAYTDKLVALGLVEIMKGLWMAQLVLFNFLLVYIYVMLRVLREQDIYSKKRWRWGYLLRCGTKKIEAVVIALWIRDLTHTRPL